MLFCKLVDSKVIGIELIWAFLMSTDSHHSRRRRRRFFSLPSIFVVALCFDFFFWFKKSIFLVANRRSSPFQHTLRIISRAFVYAFIMLITPISTKSDLFFVVVSANEDRLSLDTHTHAHKQCVTLNVSKTRVPEIHLYAFCDKHIIEIVIELQFMSKA